MPDVLVQFHADPSELINLAANWLQVDSVHMTTIQMQPFVASEVHNVSDLEAKWPVPILSLTAWPPDLRATSWGEFLKRNTGALMLEVGKLDADGLRESSLSSRCGDEAVAQVWKRFASQLRAITRAGVWVSTEDGEHRQFYRNHRYTNGAKRLQASGIRILPVAGNTVIHLGEL
jgi:hypothetical protein